MAEIEISGNSADEYALYYESPIGSHNWVLNPAEGSTGNVSGGAINLPITMISARDYRFVVTSPDGCENSLIFSVEVNEVPTIEVTNLNEIGRAHVLTPVTWPSRMPSSA